MAVDPLRLVKTGQNRHGFQQPAKLCAMNIAQVDIAYLYEAFLEQAELLLEQWRCQPAESSQTDPSRLVDAMGDLCKVLRGVEAGLTENTEPSETADTEAEALGNYGLQLLTDLSELAAQLALPECARELENLCLPLGAWVARQGGEIQQLVPIVNALAWHANRTTSPQEMLELYNLANQVFESVGPSVIDSDPGNPMHPWRLLVINRAIVATRTLEPSAMEPALAAVVEHLPDDAARFFEEGMEQMDKIGYPERVREVMSRYHSLINGTRTLH